MGLNDGLLDAKSNRGFAPLGRSGGTRTTELVRALIAARVRQRLSQREVTRRMSGSWSETVLSNLERGKGAPSVELLSCWAEGLGLRVALVDADGREVQL